MTSSTSHPSLHVLLEHLQRSLESDSDAQALQTLFSIGVVLLARGDKPQAFQVLALLTKYPLHDAMHVRVTSLMDELEFQLCPRVVSDAYARAEEMTLEDVAAELLASDFV